MEYLIFIWLGVVVVSLVIEALTYELISIWFTAGGLIAMTLAIINSLTNVTIDWTVQLIIFLVISLILVVLVRPITKKYLKRIDVKTNIDSIVGKHAFVLDDINVDCKGTVKLEGVIWTAVANEDIYNGEKVEVLAIEGNKLIVKKAK